MTQKELKKISLLAEVACDYYERGLSQNEIAERLCLSRTRVSRLLKEAEEKGIVKISINYNFERHYELEERLQSRFSLKDVRVLNNRDRNPEFIQRDVGHLAAKYIMENVKKDMVIGTSWGTTLADTVKFLQPISIPVSVVQLMGAVPCDTPNCTPQEIAASLADLLGGHADFLNLPLFIADDYVRNTMCKDNNNEKILNKGMFSDMILTSVSDISQINQKDFWLGYMTREMYTEICKKGAVGAMFARFFDSDGREIDCEWNKKCVTISFKNMKSVPNVVAIASSKLKAGALLSAMHGRLIHTLITDGTTATEILRLNTLIEH